MTRRLEFFFDYGSPFSYLVDTQLAALCGRLGAELVYRPMLLGGVYKATGNRSPAMEPVENKRRYGALMMRRWKALYDVPLRINPHWPINTLELMRGAVAAQREGIFDAFHHAVFPAFWVEGLNLGDSDVLAALLRRTGLDAKPLLERASEPGVKAELRANTEEAVQRGAFGAPTFFVRNEIFFGNDHLPFVEAALSSLSR